MLCLLLGTGFMITPLPILVVSTLLFIAGTEIRVRIEDRLLASRFGEEFLRYRRAVSAYIPFIKSGPDLRTANVGDTKASPIRPGGTRQ